MAKENEINSQQVPATPSAGQTNPPSSPSITPNEDMFMENLGKKYPDLAGNREAIFGRSMEDYDKEHEYAKTSRQQAKNIKDMLEADENVNNFLIDFWEWGGKGKAWKAFLHLQPLWRQYINGEIQDDEFEAELRRMNEEYEKTERVKDMAAKAFDRVCEKRGWDPDETRKKLSDLLFAEVNTDAEAEQQVENMFRVLDFDSAVAAARIGGRNEKIVEQKRNHPAGIDTLPRNGGAAATATAPKKTIDVFDLAGAAS